MYYYYSVHRSQKSGFFNASEVLCAGPREHMCRRGQDMCAGKHIITDIRATTANFVVHFHIRDD